MGNEQASASELKILNVLLAEKEPLSVKQISAMLKQEEGVEWAHKTIATFLKRLEMKNLVAYYKKGVTFYYYPLVEQNVYRKKEAKRFLQNYFKGSLKSFLSAFGEDEITAEELKQIKDWAENLNDE